MVMKHVTGTVDRGKVVLYALSTCIWCKKTRQFLENAGIVYDYEYVDLADPKRADEIEKTIEDVFGHVSYPSLIAPDGKVQGYRPEEIKALLQI